MAGQDWDMANNALVLGEPGGDVLDWVVCPGDPEKACASLRQFAPSTLPFDFGFAPVCTGLFHFPELPALRLARDELRSPELS